MILQRMLGFLVKRGSYLVVLLGLAVYGHFQRNAPKHPDPASGHVLPVKVPGGRRTVRHTMYLTESERSLYHASIIVMAAGAVGILGHLVMLRSRDRATSAG